VRRLGPLVPAWKPPRLQPAALLVRRLLIAGTSSLGQCRGAASSGGLLHLHAAVIAVNRRRMQQLRRLGGQA
jgi:hypothetical protein